MVGNPTRKMPLTTPVINGDDNTKMDLKEIELGGGGVDWMNVINGSSRRRAVINMIMKHRVT